MSWGVVRGVEISGNMPPVMMPCTPEDPLNLEALRDFAPRCAADTTRLHGDAATLRECIYYFLRCAGSAGSDDQTEGLGTMTVLWREAASLESAPVRRFSGAAHFLRTEEREDDAPSHGGYLGGGRSHPRLTSDFF